MAGQIAPAEPFVIEDIRVEPVPQCLVCGTAGTARYEGLRDRLFSVPGRWSERVCPRDGHLWLDPRPVTADLGKLYRTYYTHADGTTPSLRLKVKQVVEAAGREAAFGYSSGRSGWARFLVRSVVAHLPMVHDIAGSGVMWLHARHRGRLLDVGCGTGVIARTLHDLGWDVHGVEPDPEAAAIARRHHPPPAEAHPRWRGREGELRGHSNRAGRKRNVAAGDLKQRNPQWQIKRGRRIDDLVHLLLRSSG